jgi:predicted CoA-binding protein
MGLPGVSNEWTGRTGRRSSRMSDVIFSILQSYRTLAVVGLSSKPMRPSHGVAAYMQAHGYRIIPVNPNEQTVLNEKAYASLDDLPETVPVVVIFRRPEYVPAIVESAIRKGARVIWMQEGVIHEDAARRARAAGLEVIQDRCILKEHAKRFVAEGI